jgi:hypothetical protein
VVELGPGPGPQPSDAADSEFTVSATGLVSRTLSLWIRKILQYTLLMGCLYVVYLLVQTVILVALYGSFGLTLTSSIGANPIGVLINLLGVEGEPNLQFALISFILNLGGLIFLSLTAGAIVKLSFDNYGNPSAGEVLGSLSFSMSKAVSLISVQLIIGALVSIVLAPGNILFTRAMDQYDPSNPMEIPSEFVTALPLLFVGLIVVFFIQIVFAPVIAVVIAENESVFSSLKRAYELSSGNFLHIFGGYILIAIVVGITGIFFSELFYWSYPSIGVWALLIPVFLSTLFVSSASYIFITVLYRDLVSRHLVTKEEWW